MSNELNQWHREGGLLYTLKPGTPYRGETPMVNDLMVNVTAQPRDEARETALATELHQYLQHRAAPAAAAGEAGGAGSPAVQAMCDLHNYLSKYTDALLDEAGVDNWRSSMNGQFDDTFDAGVAHGKALLAETLRKSIRAAAALTPAPAQAPQPAAPRCGGGGVELPAVYISQMQARASYSDLDKYIFEVLLPACPRTCRAHATGDAVEAKGAKEGGSHE